MQKREDDCDGEMGCWREKSDGEREDEGKRRS